MLLSRFIWNFKCGKVPVNVAWGKDCRVQSDEVFAVGYPVGKRNLYGSDSNPTYLDFLSPSHLSQSTTSADLICAIYGHCLFLRAKVIVTDCNTDDEQMGYSPRSSSS